jgi:hypothetical protein
MLQLLKIWMLLLLLFLLCGCYFLQLLVLKLQTNRCYLKPAALLLRMLLCCGFYCFTAVDAALLLFGWCFVAKAAVVLLWLLLIYIDTIN